MWYTKSIFNVNFETEEWSMLAYQFNLPVDEQAVRELQTDEKSRRGPLLEAVEQINRELGRGRAGEDWFLFVFRKSADGLTILKR